MLILEVQLCEHDVSAKRSSELNSPKSYEVNLGEIQRGEVGRVLEVVLDITGGRQTSLLSKSRPLRYEGILNSCGVCIELLEDLQQNLVEVIVSER